MDTIKDTQPEVLDPLRLDRCPACGYLLCGLPEQGRCPECGSAYVPEMVVLYGWALGTRANDTNRYRARSARMLFALGAGMALIFALAGRWSLYSLLIPAGLALIAVRLAYRRKRLMADAPAPVQLRLLADGFAQRDGVGPASLEPWQQGQHLRITKWRRGRYRVRSYRWYQPSLLFPHHVNFEFKAEPQTIERLGQRIDKWRRQDNDRQLSTDPASQTAMRRLLRSIAPPARRLLVLIITIAAPLGIHFLVQRYSLHPGFTWICFLALSFVLFLVFLLRGVIWFYLKSLVKGRLPGFLRANPDGSWSMSCPRCSQPGPATPGRKGEPLFQCDHCGEKITLTQDWLPG